MSGFCSALPSPNLVWVMGCVRRLRENQTRCLYARIRRRMGIAEIIAEKRKDSRRVPPVWSTSSRKREPFQCNEIVRLFRIKT